MLNAQVFNEFFLCFFFKLRDSMNVTAEISKEHAYNFQEMCQMFSTNQKHSPAKRVPKLPPPANLPVRKALSQTSLNGSKSVTINRLNVCKVETLKSTFAKNSFLE